MALTLEIVRAAVRSDEPRYGSAATMGPAALPFLDQLMSDPEPGLAAKATVLAGLIGTPGSTAIIEKATTSNDPSLRVAAAGAVRGLGVPASYVESALVRLVGDDDRGVQKTALRSVPASASSQLKQAILLVATTSPFLAIRNLANQILLNLP